MLNSIVALLGNGVVGGDFESIATVTVGSGGAGSVTFSSIPSTYTHLQIRANATTAVSGYGMFVTFNSDTGSNYTRHNLLGNGSAVSASAVTSQTWTNIFGFSTGTNTTNPSVAIADILDYKDTNKYKTIRTLSGLDNNGSGEIALVSGLWMSTSAISTIKIETAGTNYSQYSSFALYGLKG